MTRVSPAQSALHDSFWDTVRVLLDEGEVINHHRKAEKGLIALRMPEVSAVFKKRGVKVSINAHLKRSLRLCQNPRFLELKAVNSATGKSTYCWVFHMCGPQCAVRTTGN